MTLPGVEAAARLQIQSGILTGWPERASKAWFCNGQLYTRKIWMACREGRCQEAIHLSWREARRHWTSGGGDKSGRLESCGSGEQGSLKEAAKPRVECGKMESG